MADHAPDGVVMGERAAPPVGRADAAAVGPPLGLLAELTHRCPLACGYCSNPVDQVRRGDELDAATWAAVFAEAAALGVLQAHLSGGEPGARTDLPALVAAASGAGLYTTLVTSGVGLSEARLAACVDAGLDHVQLSVQAADAAHADAIAYRPGSAAQKHAVAAHVARLGLPLTVNVVLHRANVGEVDALVALAVAWGAHRLELAHVQLMGSAWHHRATLVAAEAEVEHTAARVDAARAWAPFPIDHVRSDVHAGRPKRCMDGWGRRFLVVAPDGAMLPCHGARALPLRFARYPDVSLGAAWTSDPIARFRDPRALGGACAGCPELDDDAGGCRCQAFLASGDLHAVDPACDRSAAHGVLVALRRGGPRRPARRRTLTPTETGGPHV